jgi:hypothetical protein
VRSNTKGALAVGEASPSRVRRADEWTAGGIGKPVSFRKSTHAAHERAFDSDGGRTAGRNDFNLPATDNDDFRRATFACRRETQNDAPAWVRPPRSSVNYRRAQGLRYQLKS